MTDYLVVIVFHKQQIITRLRPDFDRVRVISVLSAFASLAKILANFAVSFLGYTEFTWLQACSRNKDASIAAPFIEDWSS